MLTDLRIENFAIIDHLELKFQSGLTTFTGETGAGKSIILDAIMVLVGGRADATFIRAGADRASVEATFHIPAAIRADVTTILKREDLLEDPNTVTLSRELRREGRSVARINGRSVALGLLQELGEYLVDIHGQSEHLSLLNVHQHLGLLDRYANTTPLLEAYRETYRMLQALRRELAALRLTEAEAVQRTDLLTFQAREIEEARLQPGEDESLPQERDRLANAESLASLAQESLLLLDEGSPESPAASDLLGQVVEKLATLSRMDASQAKLSEQAETLSETIADISHTLRDYLENIEFNPRRLEQVEERLHLVGTLKRKYGATIADVLAYAAEARQKLENIAHASERIAELETAEGALLVKLAQQGTALTQARRQASQSLSHAVEGELSDLSMNGARFMVDMRYQPNPKGVNVDGETVDFSDTGLDRVEFMIAPNPGEGFKPLVRIASGGETSRLMLALKNVLVSADHIPTLIFDEIDQGIGGRVGMVVGEKLWALGRRHQVLCVTHLPQLAAYGEQHLRVRKHVEGGRTLTQVDNLDGPARLDELAQMLGNLSDANRTAATETLELARQRAEILAKQ